MSVSGVNPSGSSARRFWLTGWVAWTTFAKPSSYSDASMNAVS